MATGAARAIAAADTDQQTGDDQRQPTGINLYIRQTAKQLPDQRRKQNTQHKQRLFAKTFAALQQATQQAANTGNPTVHKHKQTGRETNQRTAGQGAPRGKVVPIDRHHSAPAQNS
jgi:hypothetical protein